MRHALPVLALLLALQLAAPAFAASGIDEALALVSSGDCVGAAASLVGFRGPDAPGGRRLSEAAKRCHAIDRIAAFALTEKALELAPGDTTVGLNHVESLVLLEQYPEAQKLLDALGAKEPANALIAIARAELAVTLEDLPGAQRLAKPLEKHPVVGKRARAVLALSAEKQASPTPKGKVTAGRVTKSVDFDAEGNPTRTRIRGDPSSPEFDKLLPPKEKKLEVGPDEITFATSCDDRGLAACKMLKRCVPGNRQLAAMPCERFSRLTCAGSPEEKAPYTVGASDACKFGLLELSCKSIAIANEKQKDGKSVELESLVPACQPVLAADVAAGRPRR